MLLSSSYGPHGHEAVDPETESPFLSRTKQPTVLALLEHDVLGPPAEHSSQSPLGHSSVAVQSRTESFDVKDGHGVWSGVGRSYAEIERLGEFSLDPDAGFPLHVVPGLHPTDGTPGRLAGCLGAPALGVVGRNQAEKGRERMDDEGCHTTTLNGGQNRSNLAPWVETCGPRGVMRLTASSVRVRLAHR